LADNEERLDFTDAAVNHSDVKTVSNNDESFMDKVIKFFSMAPYDKVEDKLKEYGFSDEENAKYTSAIEDGKIVVLLDEREGYNTGSDRVQGSVYGGSVTGNDTLNHGAALNDDTLTNSQSRTDRYSTGNSMNKSDLTDDERKIQLREEQLEVNKEEVEAGEVVLNKEVHEKQKEIEVPVEHEEVYVERRKVNDKNIDVADTGAIKDGETIRIPVVEEKVEVSKKPVVTDEIVIGKEKKTETKTVHDNIRKEDVHLDKNGNPLVNGDSTLAKKKPLQDSKKKKSMQKWINLKRYSIIILIIR